jgi:hypothetical protein
LYMFAPLLFSDTGSPTILQVSWLQLAINQVAVCQFGFCLEWE